MGHRRFVLLFIGQCEHGCAGEASEVGNHPHMLLKIYVCRYLIQVHSSRRLEREAKRNV